MVSIPFVTLSSLQRFEQLQRTTISLSLRTYISVWRKPECNERQFRAPTRFSDFTHTVYVSPACKQDDGNIDLAFRSARLPPTAVLQRAAAAAARPFKNTRTVNAHAHALGARHESHRSGVTHTSYSNSRASCCHLIISPSINGRVRTEKSSDKMQIISTPVERTKMHV